MAPPARHTKVVSCYMCAKESGFKTPWRVYSKLHPESGLHIIVNSNIGLLARGKRMTRGITTQEGRTKDRRNRTMYESQAHVVEAARCMEFSPHASLFQSTKPFLFATHPVVRAGTKNGGKGAHHLPRLLTASLVRFNRNELYDRPRDNKRATQTTSRTTVEIRTADSYKKRRTIQRIGGMKEDKRSVLLSKRKRAKFRLVWFPRSTQNDFGTTNSSQ